MFVLRSYLLQFSLIIREICPLIVVSYTIALAFSLNVLFVLSATST